MNVLTINHDEIDFLPGPVCYWHGKPFTGIGCDFNSDGRVLSEIEYVDGIQSGLEKTYFPSGQLQSETTYQHGVAHGCSREWFENGRLKSETYYEYSVPVYAKVWNEAGQLVSDYTLGKDEPAFSLLQSFRSFYGDAGAESSHKDKALQEQLANV